MTDITELALREKFEAWLSPCLNVEKFVDDDGDVQYVEDYVQGVWLGFNAVNAELADALEKAQQRIAELESRLNSAEKLQDSAFRSGLQHGFSLGQTGDEKGYEQSMDAYSPAAGIKREAE